VQLAYGPRIPLLIFGGPVKPGIDSRWCGHASITKTAIDLLGLPAHGVPPVDQAPSLADLVDPNQAHNAAPPAYGTPITLPTAPSPTRPAHPLPPPPVTTPAPVAEIILRDGSTLPPPNDAPLPQQPRPPGQQLSGQIARTAARTRSTSPSNEIPAASAACGSRLVSVSPGIGLSSSTNSSPVSCESIRSTRPKPAQPSSA